MFQPLGPHMGGYYASGQSLVAAQVAMPQSPVSLPPPPPPPPGQAHHPHSLARTPLGHPRPKNKSQRREKSEISCCLKYVIFGSNAVFWTLGLCVMMVGFWAWTEKDIFNNFSRITHLTLDPAFILIVGGSAAFTIGLTGCVGALRENTCLLAGVRTSSNSMSNND